MRLHQFEIDPHCGDDANLSRLRAYIRNRFGRAVPLQKGKALRARAFRRMIDGRPLPRRA